MKLEAFFRFKIYYLNSLTEYEHPQPFLTEYEHPQPFLTEYEHPQPFLTEYEHPQPFLTEYGHPQPFLTEYEHPQPFFLIIIFSFYLFAELHYDHILTTMSDTALYLGDLSQRKYAPLLVSRSKTVERWEKMEQNIKTTKKFHKNKNKKSFIWLKNSNH